MRTFSSLSALLILCLAAAGAWRCSAASPALHFAVSVGQRVDSWANSMLTTRRRSKTAGNASRLQKQNPSVVVHQRGGASVAAAKTMTARQMEAFNLFSGGVAGTVASCLTNPLDVVKTQLQSSSMAAGEFVSGRGHPLTVAKQIMEKDGLSGFFRGLPSTLVGIIPARSAYFYAYQRIKHALGPYLPEGSPPNALVAGFMAGIAGNTLTNPIWMVRTRMQLLADSTAGQKAYSGHRDAIATIWREEGLAGFYKGIFASYWGCAEGAVQFILYEQMKSRLLERQNRRRAADGLPPSNELSNLSYFLSAAAAKMCASIATYPHEVARTRLREQARSGVFKYKGMWQTLAVIAREEGRQGLYSGMGIHLVKVVPNSALMFLTYEIVRGWLSGFTVIDEDLLSEQQQ